MKQILVEEKDFEVSLKVIDEIIFTLIRLDAFRRLDIRRLDQPREYIRKHCVKEFANVLNDVEELIEELGIIVLEDKGSLGELLETVENYNLLPGDALIAIKANTTV